MTTELPAGWYRDARGAQSYWDDISGTPCTPSAPPGPAPGAPPTYGPPHCRTTARIVRRCHPPSVSPCPLR